MPASRKRCTYLRRSDAFLAIACRAKTPAARDADAHLREEVDRRGLRADVAFVGETARILDLLATADVVLLPSETLYAKMDLPLVLLEAMALGRAVIVASGTPAGWPPASAWCSRASSASTPPSASSSAWASCSSTPCSAA